MSMSWHVASLSIDCIVPYLILSFLSIWLKHQEEQNVNK